MSLLGTVTRVEAQKRNKSRVNIYTDGEYLGSCDAMVWQQAGVKQGEPLPEERWQEIQTQHEERAAFDRALTSLEAHAMTRTQVERKLHDKGYSDNAIQSAVEKLLRYGYLNDAAYAEAFVRDKAAVSGQGRVRIQNALRMRGVDKDTAQTALEEFPQEDEYESARRYYETLQRKYASEADIHKKRSKIAAAMQRRGFSWDIVSDITNSMEK